MNAPAADGELIDGGSGNSVACPLSSPNGNLGDAQIFAFCEDSSAGRIATFSSRGAIKEDLEKKYNDEIAYMDQSSRRMQLALEALAAVLAAKGAFFVIVGWAAGITLLATVGTVVGFIAAAITAIGLLFAWLRPPLPLPGSIDKLFPTGIMK